MFNRYTYTTVYEQYIFMQEVRYSMFDHARLLPSTFAVLSSRPDLGLHVATDNAFDGPRIMPRLSQIIQSGAPDPALRTSHDLDTDDVRAEDFEPHLDADSSQMVAEQHARVEPRVSDVQARPAERVARPGPEHEDVAYSCALRVGFAEELCAGAARVQDREFRGGKGGQSIGTGFGGVFGRRVYFDVLEMVLVCFGRS